MRRRFVVVVVLVLALVSAACASDSSPRRPAGPSTTAADGAGFGTTNVNEGATERALLVRVRATRAGPVERVTFEFEDALPGYRVGYVEQPVLEDGSGELVEIDGVAVLQAQFEPASGFDMSGGGRVVFKGPERLDLATKTVTDVVRVGDFEAVLTWAIGLDAAGVPFHVVPDPAAKTITVEVQTS